jgi:nucleoside-diphosphate-sugar epimerase
MHVILGAGGAISDSLCAELRSGGIPLTLVSRRASPSAFGRSVSADLLQAGSLNEVLERAETAYLLAGLPYKLSVWQQQWPTLVRNVVESCAQTSTKLVFLDNIYMLSDGSMPHMTESSPMEPSSGKGRVRVEVDRIILEAASAGRISACIARSADFYGYIQPNKSMLLDLVLRKMALGKRPMWFYTVDRKHAFSYVPDIGRALALLGSSDTAWGKIWNVPTAPAKSLAEIIALVNEWQGTTLRPVVTGEFMTAILRLFIPPLAEMKELKYQLVQDYVLDSSVFEAAFPYTATPMETGLKQVLEQIRNEKG